LEIDRGIGGAMNAAAVGQPVFIVAGRTYFWEDVILAGLAWGEWPALERELAAGLAALSRARAEDALPTAEQLDKAARAFRYEHNLISAQEAHDWLERLALTAEDWLEYLRRRVARGQFPDDAPSRSVAPPWSARQLHAEAVCSGTLERLARELATRAACLALSDGRCEQELREEETIDEGILADACRLGIRIARSRERLMYLARVERSYRGVRARALSASAIAQEVAAHRLEWTRIVCDTLSFESAASAREAALCVRVDHQPLCDVGAAAHRQAAREVIYLDDSSPVVARLFGAREGDVVGPVEMGSQYVVFEVLDRIPAATADTEVNLRAESSILHRLATRELAPMVQWQTSF
jgi:hypothetical protein